MQGRPTSPYGNELGFDSSVRVVQLSAKLPSDPTNPEPARTVKGRHPEPSTLRLLAPRNSHFEKGYISRVYLRLTSRFRTVEIDSTYYGMRRQRRRSRVGIERHRLASSLPPRFPQVITHTNTLLNCEAEFDEFIGRMTLLNEKLGPLLFQCPHFSKYQLNEPDKFLRGLRLFLKRATAMSTVNFAVEIRNRAWLNSRLTVCSANSK